MRILVIRKRLLLGFVIIAGIVTVYFGYFNRQAIEVANYAVAPNELQEQLDGLLQGKEKVAYLTFDDGPNPSITPKVLDILKKENVPATFFVIGKHVETYPELVKRAYEEGHYILGWHLKKNRKAIPKFQSNFIEPVVSYLASGL